MSYQTPFLKSNQKIAKIVTVPSIEDGIARQLSAYRGQPNCPDTWQVIAADIGRFLCGRLDYFFSVTCDSTNNTPETIEKLELHVTIHRESRSVLNYTMGPGPDIIYELD
jgi:hypothetical protein